MYNMKEKFNWYDFKEWVKDSLLGTALVVMGVVFIIALIFSIWLVVYQGYEWRASSKENTEVVEDVSKYEVINREDVGHLCITKFKDLENGKVYIFVSDKNNLRGSLLEVGE